MLKISDIKYFIEPFSLNDLSVTNISKSEYKEISQNDFEKILSNSRVSTNYPYYFINHCFNLKDFIIKTIKILYNSIKYYESSNVIEIKQFINILKDVLYEYGIKFTIEELEVFYSTYSFEFGFKHLQNMDPNTHIELYTRSGKKMTFDYISLE